MPQIVKPATVIGAGRIDSRFECPSVEARLPDRTAVAANEHEVIAAAVRAGQMFGDHADQLRGDHYRPRDVDADLQVLTETYAAADSTGIKIVSRWDIALPQPSAVVKLTGVT